MAKIPTIYLSAVLMALCFVTPLGAQTPNADVIVMNNGTHTLRVPAAFIFGSEPRTIPSGVVRAAWFEIGFAMPSGRPIGAMGAAAGEPRAPAGEFPVRVLRIQSVTGQEAVRGPIYRMHSILDPEFLQHVRLSNNSNFLQINIREAGMHLYGVQRDNSQNIIGAILLSCSSPAVPRPSCAGWGQFDDIGIQYYISLPYNRIDQYNDSINQLKNYLRSWMAN